MSFGVSSLLDVSTCQPYWEHGGTAIVKIPQFETGKHLMGWSKACTLIAAPSC